MNVREQVLLEYEGLQEGQGVAGDTCPVCQGGGTRERSFSVTRRDGTLYFKCHRASCAFSGAATSYRGSDYGARTKVPECRGTVGRTILRESSPLDEITKNFLRQTYSIREEHVAKWGIGWDDESSSLVLPVYDRENNCLGVNLRFLDGRKPKTKLHTEDGAISWYVNPTAAGIIIVEDQLSAIRASDYLTSVALLGTHFNEERAVAIKESGLQPVYLALDRDAWDRAVKYAIAFRYLIRLRLLRITKDLKDTTDEELSTFMRTEVMR